MINPDMPWNEEIRATWARHERLAVPDVAALPGQVHTIGRVNGTGAVEY